MNNKILLFFILTLVFSNSLSGQLSFLSVIDSFPGSDSEFAPIPEGFITFNASKTDISDYGFQMSKFDKCGNIEWTKEYSSEISGENHFRSPEAVMDKSGYIYIVLSNTKEQGEGNLLFKLTQNGNIEWSYLLHGTKTTSKTSNANILYNKYTDTLSLTLNNDNDNATIIQFDKDGSLLAQKEFEGFRFHTSQIANDGSIIMANDTAIIKVDDQLNLVWAKRLNSHSQFVQSNDPIVELDDQINLMAVDTFGSALDSFYYSLITLDEDGEFVNNSDGVRGVEFGSVDLQHRGNNSFLFLDRNLGTLIEGNTSMVSSQTDYAFCHDTIPFLSTNMNTCIDNSLLMSGFYYENTDSIQFFMGKTDPMGLLNCDEKSIDSIEVKPRQGIIMDSIHFDALNFNMLVDSIAFDDIEFIPEQEMPCFTAVVEDQSNEYYPCPCEEQALAVTWHKGAEYLWSTGDSTNFIVVDGPGTYTVNVNLCGTEVMSTFVVDYKRITECVDKVDNSPLCPGLYTSLRILHAFGNELELNWSTEESGDSIQVTTPGSYIVDMIACGFTDSYTFEIDYLTLDDEECKLVKIPNAFAPKSTNYDDNKVFKIYTKLDESAFTEFSMKIFDRWGEKVYETNDPFAGWTGDFRGSKMPPGVYLYNISYEIDLLGEVYSENHQGQVILIK